MKYLNNYKYFINEGRRTKSLDFKGDVRDMIKEYAPWYDFDNVKSRIYRGLEMYMGHDYFKVDPKGYKRTSAYTENYYTWIIDNDESWSGYPKRSESIICSTSINKTMQYGESFLVVPIKENSKFGVCPREDIWSSFPEMMEFLKDKNWNILGNEIRSIGQFIRVVKSIFSGFGFYPNNFQEFREQFDFVYENWDMISSRYYNWERIEWEEMLAYMSPFENGFKTVNYNNNTILKGNVELWTDQPCLLINERRWE